MKTVLYNRVREMHNIIMNAGLFMLFIVFGSLILGLGIFASIAFAIGILLFGAAHYIMRFWDFLMDLLTTSE